jgi:hypothetical protein
MPLRSTVLSLLVLTAGCAASVPSKPAPKPHQAHASPPPAPAPPPPEEEKETPAEEPGAASAEAPPPDAAATPVAATTPAAPPAPKADPFGDVGFREVNERDWLAHVRENIAQREKIPPAEVRLSPGLLRAVFVRSPPPVAARPGRRPPPRRHEIVVVDNQGRQVAAFRPITSRGSDEPPGDLRFLSEDRLVYEVVSKAPPPPGPKAKGRPAARASKARAMTPPAPPVAPPRLFVIQPVEPKSRPIRCQGFNFTFTRQHDRFAFVGGPSGTAYVAVDGAQVYPRRGRTTVASAPVWSKDGHSLAFLELPATAHPARLVLVAAIDDPRADLTWDLPPDSKIDGAAVVWAGTGKLVVRKPTTRPIFSASFVTER